MPNNQKENYWKFNLFLKKIQWTPLYKKRVLLNLSTKNNLMTLEAQIAVSLSHHNR